MTTTLMNQTSNYPQAQTTGPVRAAVSVLRRGFGFFQKEFARRRAIARLEEFDDHLLRDIGISHSEIQAVVYGRTMPAAHRSTSQHRSGF